MTSPYTARPATIDKIERDIRTRESLVFAARTATLEQVARVATKRWAIEEGFEPAKQELWVDAYQVRCYHASYRYTMLASRGQTAQHWPDLREIAEVQL